MCIRDRCKDVFNYYADRQMAVRGLGPRWPSTPSLGAHAQTRPAAATSGLTEPSPLFLRRVVVAGDDYDDVIDDVSAYGLKRSK